MVSSIAEFVFGPPVTADLPARVADDVRKRQNDAEKLISWVQLALATVLGLLWVASPPPLATVQFEPVPWAVACYAAFTLIRLFLSYRIDLPFWLLTLSILMDVALLMTLIWSFHIQYIQPPSFYLKVPTLLYVFVFISLRALRFEPIYVAMTGIASILGWVALMSYVIMFEGDHDMITRNYVEYLTSNKILIGAEIDKVISIGLVTAVLAAAAVRARRSFIHSVIESMAASDLSRFVSREFANRIKFVDRDVKPGDGEERTATMLFTDIEGFSTLSEHMEPSELASTLNEYFEAISSCVERHHGVINMFQGDAMLIVFNALNPDPDHATNAVNCARELVSICEARKFGAGVCLKTRCGINTGKVIVGVMGSEERLVFTVYGDNVNLAARLEQKNKEFGTYILLSEQTRIAAVTDLSAVQQHGSVTVKGRATPTSIYSLPSDRKGS